MRFVCLVSTGIDSPVASYLMSQHGEIILVHSYNYPFIDSDEREIFIKLAGKLREVIGKSIKIYILPHGIALSEIVSKIKRDLICILCKRFMLRYGEIISRIEKGDAIVTGDSLGQVASQTLENMFVEEYGIGYPVIRPLIGFDKDEIVRIARDIGTFEISTEKKMNCHAAPKRPSIKANLSRVLEEEKKINADDIIKRVFDKVEKITL